MSELEAKCSRHEGMCVNPLIILNPCRRSDLIFRTPQTAKRWDPLLSWSSFDHSRRRRYKKNVQARLCSSLDWTLGTGCQELDEFDSSVPFVENYIQSFV